MGSFNNMGKHALEVEAELCEVFFCGLCSNADWIHFGWE